MRSGAKDQLRFSAPPRLDLTLLISALPEDYRASEPAPGEYLVEGSESIIPARIGKAKQKEVQRLAVAAFQAVDIHLAYVLCKDVAECLHRACESITMSGSIAALPFVFPRSGAAGLT